MTDPSGLGVAVSPAEMARCLREGVGFVVDERTGCRRWINRASTGYGPFLAAWEATHGELPAGMMPYHTCRGGPLGCIWPDHLDLAAAGEAPAGRRDPVLGDDERAVFARRVRDERDGRAQTRAQFARDLGVGASTVAGWETGRSAPTVDEVTRMHDVFGWDGQPRRWVVTVAVQRVVTARSAGEAARQVRDAVNAPGHADKVIVGDVRVIT